MQDKLRNIILYIVKMYPYSKTLTISRIEKLIYLIDWEYVTRYKIQMTNISWYFDHYGPYSSDIYNILNQDKDIKIQKDTSNFGTVRYLVEPRKDTDSLNYKGLSDKEIEVIDEVITNTRLLTWNQLIRYVYATPPIREGKKHTYLNLEKFDI